MESVTTALTTLSTDLSAMLGSIAPLAIAVFGVIFAWRLGKRFFSSIAK